MRKSCISNLVLSVCLFMGIISNNALAQTELEAKIDSTLASLRKLPSEEKRKGYRSINYLIVRKGNEHAQALFDYAIEKDNSDLAKLIFYKGYSKVLSRAGNTKEALQLKLKGLALAEKRNDTFEIIEYNTSIANNYLFQNMPDKATYYLNIVEPLALKENNSDHLADIYYNRAMLGSMMGNENEAKEYYLEMYGAVKDQENTSKKRFVLYILVDYFSQINDPIRLATFTEILAELYEDAHPNTPAGHMPIKNIFDKRNEASSIPLYKKTFLASDSLGLINSMVMAGHGIAATYLKLNEPKKGIPYLEKAEQKLKNLHKPQLLADVYHKLTELHIAADNYPKAYDYKTLESKLRDSVRSERVQNNIAELEIKYDTEKNERIIAEQELIIERKSKQRNQLLIGLIAILLLGVLSWFFFRKRIKDQKTIALQKTTLQANEIRELKQENKLLALNNMIEGQENERFRIAQDLHDSLGGLLSTVKAHFTTIQNEIAQLESLNITEKTNHLIDEACMEVRRISHNMMPHALSISGLKGAIEDILENLNEQGFKATFEANNLPKIDHTKEVMIYRLLQESTTNIAKHSQAKNVFIQLFGHKNEVTLIVEDDGKGFDYEKTLEQAGKGLKNINSRVEFLNGTIHWDSEPGKGTTININIPQHD